MPPRDGPMQTVQFNAHFHQAVEVLMGNSFSDVCDFQAANPHERKESYFFDSSG